LDSTQRGERHLALSAARRSRLGYMANLRLPFPGAGVIPGQGAQSKNDHETRCQHATHPRLHRLRAVGNRSSPLAFYCALLGYPCRLFRLVGTLGGFAFSILTKQVHGRPPRVARSTEGAMVPESNRSPPPVNPLFTMQPFSLPRRTTNSRATR